MNDDGRPDLLIIPYERDITDPSQNAVTVFLGDGMGAFRPMPGSPLPLGGCHGADSVTAGDLLGDGRHDHDIVVACAESRNLMIFERDGDGRFTPSSQPSGGGWVPWLSLIWGTIGATTIGVNSSRQTMRTGRSRSSLPIEYSAA